MYTEIRRASGYNYRPAGFRRLLGDDIKPKETCDKQLRKAKWGARKARFVSMMKEASQVHLVVDTIIATVAFTAGVTMPGGFIGHDAGPHSGSPILIRNTAFKAFIITNTIAMVQYCSAAFIYLYMPLLFHDNNPGRFTFLLASLAFCLSISAMGAMLLAFVITTFAVLMHSLGLAISNCVIIGLFFFIPALFIIIGCSHYYYELIWSMSCISWDFENVLEFFGNLLEICGNVWLDCGNLCVDLCYEAPKRYFLNCRRSQSSRNDADQSTPS